MLETDENLNNLMDFYCYPRSPPCRAVHLTAIALGIKLNEKHVDLMKFEQLDPSFVQVFNAAGCKSVRSDSVFVKLQSRPNKPKIDNTHENQNSGHFSHSIISMST